MDKPSNVEITEERIKRSYRVHKFDDFAEIVVRENGRTEEYIESDFFVVADTDTDGDEMDQIHVHPKQLPALIWALQQKLEASNG